MTQNAKTLGILMIVVALCVPALWAQRVNPVGPAAPIGEDEESSSKRLDEPVKDAPAPDDRPLGGAETFSLGKLTEGRKYFRYDLNLSQRLETNTGSTNNLVRGVSHLGGGFELRRSLPHSELIAEYEGGGLLHTDSSTNSSFHQLSVRQSWQRGRWGFLLGDQLTYAPDSPYSLTMAGHFVNIEFNINGESFINPIFIPGQGIVTGNTDRFGNATIAQVRYLLGPRTSVFAAGGYGFLNFSDSNFTDFTQRNGVVGVERSLNGRDSLGVNYGFTQFQFSRGGSVVKTHTVRLAYGRRLTNRMAMQIDGGPQIGMFNDPVLGPTQRLFWTVSGLLQYRWGRSTLGFSYRHDLNGGSGVLAGAESDIATLSWQRRLTPRWDLGVSAGYTRSKGLQTFSGSVAHPSFETEFAGVRMTRKLASDRNLHIGYHASHQAGSVGCGSSCGFPLRHSFEVGFSWSPRPHRID
jgi:hypothetical protein